MPIVFNTYVCVLFGHDVYIYVSYVWAASRPSRWDQLTQQRVGEGEKMPCWMAPLHHAASAFDVSFDMYKGLFWHVSGSLFTYENIMQALYHLNIVETRKKDVTRKVDMLYIQCIRIYLMSHTFVGWRVTHVCRLKRSVFVRGVTNFRGVTKRGLVWKKCASSWGKRHLFKGFQRLNHSAAVICVRESEARVRDVPSQIWILSNKRIVTETNTKLAGLCDFCAHPKRGGSWCVVRNLNSVQKKKKRKQVKGKPVSIMCLHVDETHT